MQGRTCLITGANSGIGRAAAMALASMGATVLMVCRDRERGDAARSEIAGATSNESVDLLLADLSSQKEVRRLAAQILEQYPALHVLINNAGVFLKQRSVTVDGIETTLAVNHLAPFLLTNLLLNLVKAGGPARIINVSSGAHTNAHINFDDIQGATGYSGWRAYGQSKLANILFSYELCRRLAGSSVTVNALHPGVVATNFGRTSGFVRFGMRAAGRFILTPEQGADTVVYLASSPAGEGMSGAYFVKRKAVRSSAASYDGMAQQRLWDLSEQMTGPSA